MIVGCGEWGFRELPLEEHFRIARDFGFRFLEFGIGGGQVGRLPEQMSEGDVETFRTLANEYAIKTPFCCIENDFTLPDAVQHEAMVTKVQDQIRWAAQCGATHVRLFAGFTPSSEIWTRMTHAFASCEAITTARNMSIAIETHGGIRFHDDGSATHFHSVSTDRQALERLLAELPSNIGINYDPGNLKAVAPEDHRYALDIVNRRVNYCHLKDWQRQGAGWVACAPGDDDLDYGKLLPQLDFDGVYLIEYEPLEDTEDGIRRSLEYLRSIDPDLRFA